MTDWPRTFPLASWRDSPDSPAIWHASLIQHGPNRAIVRLERHSHTELLFVLELELPLFWLTREEG